MAAADPAPNSTMLAARVLPAPAGWAPGRSVPFSSARKWSAMELGHRGTWVLGASEVVFPRLPTGVASRMSAHAAAGRRVLVLAATATPLVGEDLPSGLAASGLVVLEERLRPEAARTLDYLQRQGVAVKVLSGDSPATAVDLS